MSWENELDSVLGRFDLLRADPKYIQALHQAVRTFRSGSPVSGDADGPTLSRTAKENLAACATGLGALHRRGRRDCVDASLLRHQILKDLTAQHMAVIAEHRQNNCVDMCEIRALIECGTETTRHLDALVEIVEKIPSPKPGRRVNQWPPLGRAALAVWSAAGRSERYSNRAESGVNGPLVEFLRQVLALGAVRRPSDYALRDFIGTYKS